MFYILIVYIRAEDITLWTNVVKPMLEEVMGEDGLSSFSTRYGNRSTPTNARICVESVKACWDWDDSVREHLIDYIEKLLVPDTVLKGQREMYELYVDENWDYYFKKDPMALEMKAMINGVKVDEEEMAAAQEFAAQKATEMAAAQEFAAQKATEMTAAQDIEEEEETKANEKDPLSYIEALAESDACRAPFQQSTDCNKRIWKSNDGKFYKCKRGLGGKCSRGWGRGWSTPLGGGEVKEALSAIRSIRGGGERRGNKHLTKVRAKRKARKTRKTKVRAKRTARKTKRKAKK
jgi:hypothetical protein